MSGLPPPAPPLKALGAHDDRGGRFPFRQGEVRRGRQALSASAARLLIEDAGRSKSLGNLHEISARS